MCQIKQNREGKISHFPFLNPSRKKSPQGKKDLQNFIIIFKTECWDECFEAFLKLNPEVIFHYF